LADRFLKRRHNFEVLPRDIADELENDGIPRRVTEELLEDEQYM
jgi:hypothetical protein